MRANGLASARASAQARAARHERAGEGPQEQPVQLLAREIAMLDPVEDGGATVLLTDG